MAARKAATKRKSPAKRNPAKSEPAQMPVSVVEAVERDLAAFAKRDKELARSGLAAAALTLARELDNPKNSATSKSMCARALTEQLEHLRDLLPEESREDTVDELRARRAARLAREPTSTA